MTMPEKIWIRSVGNGNGGLYSTIDRSESGPCTTYIRADIADELARALDHEVKRSRRHLAQSTLDALAHYRTATEGK